jgi:hypothetical protein
MACATAHEPDVDYGLKIAQTSALSQTRICKRSTRRPPVPPFPWVRTRACVLGDVSVRSPPVAFSLVGCSWAARASRSCRGTRHTIKPHVNTVLLLSSCLPPHRGSDASVLFWTMWGETALSTDPKGYLRPVRCKACGMAARPTAARCNTCRTTWQTCASKPTPGAGSAIRSAIRASREWVIPYATDFSGMDMTSFAMDRVLLGDIGSEQRWASDIWDGDRRHKPMPGPPIAIYVAGPPCQPWARWGKKLGDADRRAPLLDQVLATVAGNRPLAFPHGRMR